MGLAVAALVTPSLTKRYGMRAYVTALSVLAARMMVFPAALFTPWAIVVSAFGLGIATRGVKICVDTTLQRVVGDIYRGRVFALTTSFSTRLRRGDGTCRDRPAG